jgi:hypothetical protein
MIQTSTNSSTAFQVDNSSGTSLLTVDTNGNNVTIDNSAAAGTVQIGNTTGAVAQTINIGTNNTAGSAEYVTIGSTNSNNSITLNETGNTQTYIVPSGVTSINVTLYGAAGGTSSSSSGTGGLGGETQGTLNVTPGEVLTIIVAGAGGSNSGVNGGTGGYGGGGAGGNGSSVGGGGGGGASQILNGATELAIAAGGGGAAGFNSSGGGAGGNTGSASGGGGGTQSSGGTGGGNGATNGGSPTGGAGGGNSVSYGGGGGGSGYWGGGGGGSVAGGGGGSAYVPAGGSTTAGVQSGNGKIIITPTSGPVNLQAGTASETLSSSGETSIQSSTNYSDVFQVANATGNQQLLINNAATSNLIMYPSFASGSFTSSSAGWVAVSPGTIVQNTVAADSYDGVDSLDLTTTTSNGGAQTTAFTGTLSSTTYYVSFYVMPGTAMNASAFTITLNNGTNNYTCNPASQALSTTSFIRVSCSIAYTSGASSTLTIAQNDSTARTNIYISDVQLQTTGVTNYQLGTLQLPGTTITSPAIFQNSANSTTAFQVQNAAGSNILTVNTTNSNVALGTLGSIAGSLVLNSTSTG